MKKCDAYYRRKTLMENNEFPLQSEIIARHKDNLTRVLNEYIGKPLKKDIGLIPKLDGAKEDLWVSPSDLLIPNVRIKPPLTSKYVKALTHTGILEIGKEIQEKYQNNVIKRVNVEMKLLADKLNFLCKQETTRAVIQEKVQGEQHLQMEMRRMEIEYNDKLKQSLNELHNRMLVIQDLKLYEQKIAITAEMEQKLNDTLAEKTQSLLNEFRSAFEIQAQKHTKDLAEAIRQEEEKISKALKNANADKLEALRLLRHDLECRNMANVMYILTAERNRCEEERQTIYEEYKIIIDEMTTKALDLYNRILNLEYICDIQDQKLQSWENQTLHLCHEFQRFINYAFNSHSTQAEYFINIHNFVYHHIKENIKIKHKKDELIGGAVGGDTNTTALTMSATSVTSTNNNNCDIINYNNIITRNLLKLTTKDKESFLPQRFKTTTAYNNMNNINSDSPRGSRETLDSKASELPTFMYNKYLYIREDFRNKKSLNLINDEESEYNIWKETSKESKLAKERRNLGKDGSNSYVGRSHMPTSSNVHFHIKPSDDNVLNDSHRLTDLENGGGQQTYINELMSNDSDSIRIEVKSQDGGRTIENNKNTERKKSDDKNRGSILRRTSEKSTRKSGGLSTSPPISNNNGVISTPPPTKSTRTSRKIPEEGTYDELAHISSVVDVVSDNTNKYASKLLVARNSLVIHQSKQSHRALLDTQHSSNQLINAIITTSPISSSASTRTFHSSQQAIIPSRLTLVRDSVELLKEKSTFSAPTLKMMATSSPPQQQNHKFSKKSTGKSLVLITEGIVDDTLSYKIIPQSNSKTDNGDETFKPNFMPSPQISLHSGDYDEIVMGWSEASKLQEEGTTNNYKAQQYNLLKTIKTSRVAIIEEPVNVIHNTNQVVNDGLSSDDLHKLSFNNLELIDKRDRVDPKLFYYSKELQTSNDGKNDVDGKQMNCMIVGDPNIKDDHLDPNQFMQTRREEIVKLHNKNKKIFEKKVPKRD